MWLGDCHGMDNREHAEKVADNYISENEPKALNIDLVIWRCSQDLFMDDGRKIFTKGKEYKQVDPNRKWAYDDELEEHGFGEWEKYFIAI